MYKNILYNQYQPKSWMGFVLARLGLPLGLLVGRGGVDGGVSEARQGLCVVERSSYTKKKKKNFVSVEG